MCFNNNLNCVENTHVCCNDTANCLIFSFCTLINLPCNCLCGTFWSSFSKGCNDILEDHDKITKNLEDRKEIINQQPQSIEMKIIRKPEEALLKV